MINLLPPAVKDQMRHAQYNRAALRYLQLVVIVLAVLAAIFVTSIYFIRQQSAQLGTYIKDKEEAITKLKSSLSDARVAADRLTAISTISASQTRFSHVLAELTKQAPADVTMESVTLTGDAAKPLQLHVQSRSYASVLAFRDNLAKSAIVSGVDLTSIQQSNPTTFSGDLVIAFKPGFASRGGTP